MYTHSINEPQRSAIVGCALNHSLGCKCIFASTAIYLDQHCCLCLCVHAQQRPGCSRNLSCPLYAAVLMRCNRVSVIVANCSSDSACRLVQIFVVLVYGALKTTSVYADSSFYVLDYSSCHRRAAVDSSR